MQETCGQEKSKWNILSETIVIPSLVETKWVDKKYKVIACIFCAEKEISKFSINFYSGKNVSPIHQNIIRIILDHGYVTLHCSDKNLLFYLGGLELSCLPEIKE